MDNSQLTTAVLLQRIDALTKAVQHLAQVNGARLTKAQLADRFGCHRNTLPRRTGVKGFPKPCADGKWMLSEIIEWEQESNLFH